MSDCAFPPLPPVPPNNPLDVGRASFREWLKKRRAS